MANTERNSTVLMSPRQHHHPERYRPTSRWTTRLRLGLPLALLLLLVVPVSGSSPGPAPPSDLSSPKNSQGGWKAKLFPDIRGPQWRLCGEHISVVKPQTPSDVAYKPYVCDPDHLLNATEAKMLNTRLQQLAVGTPCHCQRRSQCTMDDHNGKGFSLGFVVAVALVKQLKMTIHSPSTAQIQEYAEDFGQATQGRWALGDCGNSVVILLWEEYHKVYISTSRVTKKYLTKTEIDVILASVQPLLTKSQYSTALMDIIGKIHLELMGEPEQPVDIGTLSLIIAVGVAVTLVCIITGCVCAFRCCGNLFPKSAKKTSKPSDTFKRNDSFKTDIFNRSPQVQRSSLTRTPNLPHTPRNAAYSDGHNTQVMLAYMRDQDTTMV